MLPSVPIPVDRVVVPPNTDTIKHEDDAAEKRVEDARREPPKEPFDAHLHRLMPPGWAPTPDSPTADPLWVDPESLLLGATPRPGWLMKALGDLTPDQGLGQVAPQTVVLHVLQPQAHYDSTQILSAVKEGAPIHEAHFPGLFAAQFVQMKGHGTPVSQLSVQIAPEHLGALQLKFTLREQTMAVSVVAANREAKELVERQLGAIQSVLAAHHFKPAELKVEVASQGAGANGGQGSDQGEPYQTPNRWLLRRKADLDEGIDVAVG